MSTKLMNRFINCGCRFLSQMTEQPLPADPPTAEDTPYALSTHIAQKILAHP